MAEEEIVEEAAAGKSGGMLKMLMFGGAGIALLVIGIVAGPAVMNMISPADGVGGADDEAAEEVAVDKSKPEIYQSLHPPLVVNFKDAYGDGHFMQITLEVMARDQDVINAVREHTPVIRSNLILMFSAAQYESVVTREGKVAMLNEALAEIQKIMQERIGRPGVEGVYFTNLVIQ